MIIRTDKYTLDLNIHLYEYSDRLHLTSEVKYEISSVREEFFNRCQVRGNTTSSGNVPEAQVPARDADFSSAETKNLFRFRTHVRPVRRWARPKDRAAFLVSGSNCLNRMISPDLFIKPFGTLKGGRVPPLEIYSTVTRIITYFVLNVKHLVWGTSYGNQGFGS